MKQFKLLVLSALTSILMFSCDRGEVEPADPGTPQLAFSASYRIPLLPVSQGVGEGEIVEAKQVEEENIADLKPVLNQVLSDAYSGKLESHPCEVDEKLESENALKSTWAKIYSKEEFDPAYLNGTVEVIMVGVNRGKHVEMAPEWLRIVWKDVAQELPDRHMARIKMDDLSGYKVATDRGEVALPADLAGQSYAHYLIGVAQGASEMGVRSLQDAVAVNALLQEGELEEVLAFNEKYMQ